MLSAVWDTRRGFVSGNTPVQDRVSYVCTSCVSEDTECPLICEFCIPHMRTYKVSLLVTSHYIYIKRKRQDDAPFAS